MDVTDTPCPPSNRRLKRRRPASPDPDSSLPLPTPTGFTAKNNPSSRPSRRPLTSLSILPKRRKIPISLVQRSSLDNNNRDSHDKPASQPPRSSIGGQNEVVENRRRSLRSYTVLPTFTSPMQANSSVLHADVSAMDSTASTIFPTSSPNTSSQSISTKLPVPPPKKRRRISEIVRRVAATAVSKTTGTTNTSAVARLKPAVTKPKPVLKPTRAIDKKKAPLKPKPAVDKKMVSTNTVPNARPALKAISRGMNPSSRPMTTTAATSSNDLIKKTSAVSRLRLQKLKAHSDSESLRKPVKPVSKKPARKSASAYPSLSSVDQSLKPELYSQTTWLSTQETLLTQVLDSILVEGTAKASKSVESLRTDLLALYNTDTYCILQDRLKASILHGALKPSEENISQNLKLSEDLGARDKFAKLFTETYDPLALRLGMEVVTGRSLGRSTPNDLEIRKFFEAFFVDIDDDEDGDGQWETYGANAHGTLRVWTEAESSGDKAWALRRTMLRSLVLVHLIDDAKMTGLLSGLVFRKSSEMKSSESVLIAAGKILLPSMANMARGVKGCGYTLRVEQKPEEEYEYAIENLKVDLRDGVRLGKVVELLLREPVEGIMMYPKSKGEKAANMDKVLAVLYRNGVVPLGSVKAKDVVDGHREVTLSLLWAVLMEKGVGFLVDFEEVEMEVRRVRMKYRIKEPIEADEDEEDQHLKKLILWVQTIALGRGVNIDKGIGGAIKTGVVEAALEEYEPLIDGRVVTAPKTSTNNEAQLKQRLKGFGCSESFLKLFTPGKETIVNQRYVLAALAFLASRVLASTKFTRSAMKVQGWWRTVQFRRGVSARISTLLEEAREHEAAIETFRRKRAAKRIQRAWRDAVERKVEELLEIVVGVQALARGCLVRRKMDYRYRPEGKKIVEKVVERKEEEDPYKLKDAPKVKKGRKKKVRHVETFEEGFDIWQELAGGDE
ncbi:hypothetical protein TWF730_010188 [Orbilia blumenaviensis]|uniref:Calponin-homology (CH) domain-containing protein n=1 Tax=Orbilia blumenaviensis TaxID=1796055 RepID=A0AAV9UNI7_9PEZI